MNERDAHIVAGHDKNEAEHDMRLDEGIGAGDASFQHKRQQRIEGLFQRTPIVLLASHAEGLVQQFCTRRLTMEHGRLVEDDLLALHQTDQ